MIAEDIFEHASTFIRKVDIYTALFAVDFIKTLGKYYDAFKALNDTRPEDERYKVAAIFTYQVNEDMDEGGDEHSVELLSRCMDDYNDMFGTAFSVDSFDAYRKDIARRMKQKDLPQVEFAGGQHDADGFEAAEHAVSGQEPHLAHAGAGC
ncbi:MAG: UvrB domain 3-containing protein [Butyricicoccus sp.]